MRSYNIHEAKTQFSKLVELASSGEDVVIAKAGEPVAKLVAYSESSEPRVPGGWERRVRIAPDFDELPPGLAAAFLGG